MISLMGADHPKLFTGHASALQGLQLYLAIAGQEEPQDMSVRQPRFFDSQRLLVLAWHSAE